MRQRMTHEKNKEDLIMRNTITKTGPLPNRARAIAALAFTVLLAHHAALGAQAPVNLGTAANYVVLAKSGISTVPPAAVTGNLGVSPIDSTAITGFSMILDGTVSQHNCECQRGDESRAVWQLAVFEIPVSHD